MTEEKLFDRISDFLEEHKSRVDTGWPEVTKFEFNELHGIIEDLIDLKWDRDVDSDAPVRVRLENRTVGRLPYSFHLVRGDYEGNIRSLMIMLESDAQDLRREWDVWQMTKEKS